MSEARRRRVLVTGAAGFTGHHMVMAAARAGLEVRATDVSSRYYGAMFDALGVEFVAGDLTRPDGLGALLDGVEAVLNVAGIHDYSTPRATMFAVNADAVEHLCAACVEHGVARLVHLSSVGVYGYDWHDGTPVREDAPKLTPPLNAYNESKLAGERIACRYGSEHGLKVTALRPAAIYGARSEYGLYNAIKHVYDARNARRTTLVGRGACREAFVHVEDVCRAMLWALDDDATIGQVYNVADDSRLTTAEFFDLVSRELLGREARFRRVPLRLLLPLATIAQLVARVTGRRPALERDTLHYMSCDRVWDTTKIKQAGFRLAHPTVEVGLREVLGWYRTNGWLRV